MTLRPQLTDGLRYNLRQVLPDASERSLRRLARRNIINYAKAWVDFFTVPRMSRESRDAVLSITGWENLNAILERGKGCIPVSIHMGAWDAAIAFWGARYPSALIVEELEPPELARRMQALRGSTGTKLIPLGRAAPREMLKILKQNGLAAGAMDRDVLGSGEPYAFFGRPALIPTGLVRLAQHTGAGIMPVFCNRLRGDRYLLEGFEPVWVGPGEEGVRAATEKLLRVFEERIRQYPEQWHVTAPLWSDRPIAMSPRPARAGPLDGTREERVG
jgi:KDO2-lipid IV(A) lauroyltransferase